MRHKRLLQLAIGLMFAGSLFVGGCANIQPVDQTPPVGGTPSPAQAVRVMYNYGETGPAQLSANDIVLNVGQKLVIAPAAGLTGKTRFVSSGADFFGDVMEQQAGSPDSGEVVFVAKAAGKGRLQVIPNTTETERAAEFRVTVK